MKQIEEHKHKPHPYESHPAYVNFLGSLHTPRTIELYAHCLSKHYLSRPENRMLTLDQILAKSPKEIENEIIGIISELKRSGLSYSSLNLTLVAIIHFFQINDVAINRLKINRFKGENISKFEYRSYSTEEVSKILSNNDERGRATILLMASTGMRVGALTAIKLKHLKKWTVPHLSHYHIYQITVYANSPRNKYYTFCTPEAARAVDEYLELRRRYGDPLTPESYLFIRQFDKLTSKLVLDKRPVGTGALTKVVVTSLIAAGLRTINKMPSGQNKNVSQIKSMSAPHKNELHPCHSFRIFCITNLQRSKVDKTIREMLVGHSTGLDKSYYKPQDEEILEEYLKAVDNLTINNEHRLQKQLDYYKYRQDQIDDLALKFKELDERLKRDGL